jgi:3-oxoacyl-[acyl-carrier-protein] synthase II
MARLRSTGAAITGVGVISAIGAGRRAFSASLREGRSGISPNTLFALTGARSSWVGQAPEPELPDGIGPISLLSRADRLALFAASEALSDAGLEGEARACCATVLGTGTGGIAVTERYLERLARRGERRTPARWLLSHQPANAADLIASRLGTRGVRLSLMTACSSSATAIGVGLDLLRRGRARRVLAGGTESLCRLTVGGFSALRALDEQPCRPFHAERQGLTLGDGAALLVLEDLAEARSRGARIHAELAGYGVSADAHHLTAPAPAGRGAAAAMLAALGDAGIPPDAVDYVNAHGTGTPHNDAAEISALRRVFGGHVDRLAVSSTKAMTGHALGAAGAIEAVACLCAIEMGFLPPTLRLDAVAPDCEGIDLVPLHGRPAELEVAISNSFAFGGNNTTLVLRRSS